MGFHTCPLHVTFSRGARKLFLSGHLSLVCGSHDRQHVSSFLHKPNVLVTHEVFSVADS